MPCDVRLYDSSLVVETSNQIDIGAQDDSSKTNLGSVQTNGPVGGGNYGASLTFAKGSFVYLVFVDDRAMKLAPVTLRPLNGQEDGSLDVVLLPYPTAKPSGSSPTSFAQIAPFIAHQHQWQPPGQRAVANLVEAVVVARQFLAGATRGVFLRAALGRWMDTLPRFQISPDLI